MPRISRYDTTPMKKEFIHRRDRGERRVPKAYREILFVSCEALSRGRTCSLFLSACSAVNPVLSVESWQIPVEEVTSANR